MGEPQILGILVCNSQKVLDHKMNDGKRADGNYCFWEMPRFPKRILTLVENQLNQFQPDQPTPAPNDDWRYSEDDVFFPENVEVRLYFAVSGQVKGYFVSEALGKQDVVYELRFYSESWTPIKEYIQIKPSQGFRYFRFFPLVGGI